MLPRPCISHSQQQLSSRTSRPAAIGAWLCGSLDPPIASFPKQASIPYPCSVVYCVPEKNSAVERAEHTLVLQRRFSCSLQAHERRDLRVQGLQYTSLHMGSHTCCSATSCSTDHFERHVCTATQAWGHAQCMCPNRHLIQPPLFFPFGSDSNSDIPVRSVSQHSISSGAQTPISSKHSSECFDFHLVQ